MNRVEHALAVLSEECTEVAKEISKALRFGLDDQVTLVPSGPRGTEGPTNREKIVSEMIDLMGSYQLLVDFGVMPSLGFETLGSDMVDRMDAKALRIHAYMGYAARVGAIEDCDPKHPKAPQV